MTSKLEELAAEKKKLAEEEERLRERMGAIRRKRAKIEAAEHKECLRPLEGEPEGVRLRVRKRYPKQRWMDDARGTLKRVKRTRALVDYGARGEWDIPIDELAPADAPQGEVWRTLTL